MAKWPLPYLSFRKLLSGNCEEGNKIYTKQNKEIIPYMFEPYISHLKDY